MLVFLRGVAGDQLQALSDNISLGAFDQEMDRVRCDPIIENRQAVKFLRLEHPAQLTTTVPRNYFKQILALSL